MVGWILALSLSLSTLPPSRAAAESNDDFYYRRIAGVLVGEGGALGEDYDAMACVVRNRLARGWTLHNVLAQFHAAYRPPEPAYVDRLIVILQGDADPMPEHCDEVYFFYAEWYTKRYANLDVVPVVVVGGNAFYRYEDYRALW